jgi:hypothetical protein
VSAAGLIRLTFRTLPPLRRVQPIPAFGAPQAEPALASASHHSASAAITVARRGCACNTTVIHPKSTGCPTRLGRSVACSFPDRTLSILGAVSTNRPCNPQSLHASPRHSPSSCIADRSSSCSISPFPHCQCVPSTPRRGSWFCKHQPHEETRSYFITSPLLHASMGASINQCFHRPLTCRPFVSHHRLGCCVLFNVAPCRCPSSVYASVTCLVLGFGLSDAGNSSLKLML